MKRVFYSFILLLSLFCFSVHAEDYRAVLVADIDTGKVLYQENSTQLNYPASLTKIMTLYLTFDALERGRLHLDDYLIVSQYAANAQPVKLGLMAGSKITVEDAIKAVAVHSANDVARVLAENLKGGKEGNFADLMTRVADEIGLSQTHFENSSGLPNDEHMSTARDIALLSMAVYKHFPQYWKYFGIKTWEYNGKTYTNGNRLLSSYVGCDGMKTGYTNKSKYSLVATAKRSGVHLIAVVLGAENKDIRATVASKMLNKGFQLLGKNIDVNVPTIKEEIVSHESTSGNPIVKKIQYYENKTNLINKDTGTSGIQFGAFSSYDSAKKQAKKVFDAIGDMPTIEQNTAGLYRVRFTNVSSSYAQQAKKIAIEKGIDCYMFH